MTVVCLFFHSPIGRRPLVWVSAPAFKDRRLKYPSASSSFIPSPSHFFVTTLKSYFQYLGIENTQAFSSFLHLLAKAFSVSHGWFLAMVLIVPSGAKRPFTSHIVNVFCV